MITAQGLTTAFGLLADAGYRAPADYGDREALRAALTVWSAVWYDRDDRELGHATIAYMRSGAVYWPKPGELLQHAPGARVAEVDDGDEAWGRMLGCVRRYGSYRPPGHETAYGPAWQLEDEFGERAEAAARALEAVGGWRSLCMLDDGGMAPARASFRSAWRSVTQRRALTAQEHAVSRLLDLHDAAQVGMHPDPGLIAAARALPGGGR